jgi:hypothetical protein
MPGAEHAECILNFSTIHGICRLADCIDQLVTTWNRLARTIRRSHQSPNEIIQ